MKLVIVSGLSGAGKHSSLHSLEDLGYYCVDNLPVALLESFAEQMLATGDDYLDRCAVGIDVRNRPEALGRFGEIVGKLRERSLECRILFLQSDDATLTARFSETRRRHPLSGEGLALVEAIRRERELLEPIAASADHTIDTSGVTLHQLRGRVAEWAEGEAEGRPTLLFQSFGYKHGVPSDADFVFDARCLPNPYWRRELRDYSGLDEPVRAFFAGEPVVDQVYGELKEFLEAWLPRFEHENRGYITVAVGCTGGRHRSVYLVDRLTGHFSEGGGRVLSRHRELQ